MKVKKIIISLIIINFSIFVFGGYFIGPKKVHAAAPVFARVVAGSVGERVIVSMAEKAGIKYATKEARQKAVERWNLDTYNRIQKLMKEGQELKAQELREFQERLARYNSSNVTKTEKNGFGSVILKGAMFLTGIDLIYEGYQAINDSVISEENLDVMNSLSEVIESSDSIRTIGNFTFWVDKTDTSDAFYFGDRAVYESYSTPGIGSKPGFVFLGSNAPSADRQLVEGILTKVSILKNALSISAFYVYHNPNTGKLYEKEVYSRSLELVDPLPDYGVVSKPFLPSDLPDVNDINIPSEVPEEVPLIIPDFVPDGLPENELVSEPFPWNDSGIGTVPEPNPDLDPIPDENPFPEPKPDEIPDGTLPPNSDGCKSPADDLLEFIMNSLVGNLACFNWDKLKLSGAFFTNKFPFSIPWDIGRALSATFGGLTPTDEIPSYQLKIFDWETELTIPDYFAKWFKMIRVMLLVMFDIGLVWSVRKMLGGAS